ncbi:hypothetical protein V6M85_12760 [Sulfolobus tengchongensis]|uniref:Uncharacterized protein n=1 Tax=Sulfolobus tengchongensis TaxID=207809 RepID=A0AAX4L2F7_9CREN
MPLPEETEYLGLIVANAEPTIIAVYSLSLYLQYYLWYTINSIAKSIKRISYPIKDKIFFNPFFIMLERKIVRVPLYILISFFSFIIGSILGFLGILLLPQFSLIFLQFSLFIPILVTASIEAILMIPFFLKGYHKGPAIATTITSFLSIFGVLFIFLVFAVAGNS